MKRILSLLSLMTLTCWLVSAADIDGKWMAKVQGKNGEVTETLTLKSDGNKLTGSVKRKKADVQISEGMISGQNVSFKVIHDRNGKKVAQVYKGTLSGSDLKLTMTGPRGKRDLDFKKAK
jgi:hypothetical protein